LYAGAEPPWGLAPPSPKVLPQKKKKNLKKIKILPQNLLFFLILTLPNFFFLIWPPNLGRLAPPLVVCCKPVYKHIIQSKTAIFCNFYITWRKMNWIWKTYSKCCNFVFYQKIKIKINSNFYYVQIDCQ
jgi:hypothetical protein